MVFVKTAIFLVALLALHVRAEDLKCEVKDINATSAIVKWCGDTNPTETSYSTVTIEANPVGPLVDGIVSAENVPGCETVLENLCSGEKYEVTVKRGTDQTTCEFTTDYGDVTTIEESDLDVTLVKSTTVRLSWKHARCFRREKATMYYKIQTDFQASKSVEEWHEWADKNLEDTHFHYDKTGLDHGTEYSFTFSTCKKSGNTCSSRQIVKYITTPAAAPNPPQNLNINNLKWNEFEIAWEVPQDLKVDEYRVTVQSETINLDKDVTKYPVRGLTPNTEYKVKVETVYKNVTSAATSTTVWTKEEMLNPPQNLKIVSSETNAEISWEKPSEAASIEGYRVTVGDKNEELTGDKTTFRAEGLKPNTPYMVEVVAFNQSLTSVPLSTTAWTKVLDPPQNLKCVSLEKNALNISWEKPSGTFGIEGYRVTVDEQPEDVPDDTTTFRVEELVPDTQYTVQVVAFYKEFTSLPVSITVQTKEKRYARPSNFSIIIENNNNIEIKWQAVNASEDEQDVKYQVFVDDQFAGNVSSNDTTFSKELKPTRGLTVYRLKVLARYGQGDDVSDAAERDIWIIKSGAISSFNLVQKEVLGFFTLLAIFLTWSRSC